jgi:hypothetical protein
MEGLTRNTGTVSKKVQQTTHKAIRLAIAIKLFVCFHISSYSIFL